MTEGSGAVHGGPPTHQWAPHPLRIGGVLTQKMHSCALRLPRRRCARRSHGARPPLDAPATRLPARASRGCCRFFPRHPLTRRPPRLPPLRPPCPPPPLPCCPLPVPSPRRLPPIPLRPRVAARSSPDAARSRSVAARTTSIAAQSTSVAAGWHHRRFLRGLVPGSVGSARGCPCGCGGKGGQARGGAQRSGGWGGRRRCRRRHRCRHHRPWHTTAAAAGPPPPSAATRSGRGGGAMSTNVITSEEVNYLVFRYLQESGTCFFSFKYLCGGAGGAEGREGGGVMGGQSLPALSFP